MHLNVVLYLSSVIFILDVFLMLEIACSDLLISKPSSSGRRAVFHLLLCRGFIVKRMGFSGTSISSNVLLTSSCLCFSILKFSNIYESKITKLHISQAQRYTQCTTVYNVVWSELVIHVCALNISKLTIIIYYRIE